MSKIKVLRTEYKVEGGKPLVYLPSRDNRVRKISIDSGLIAYFCLLEEDVEKLGKRQMETTQSDSRTSVTLMPSA